MFRKLKALFTRNWLSDEQYRQQLSELLASRPVPIFWLFGKTGSGKTSIIRQLTGAEDAEIGTGFKPQTKASRQFDFPDSEQPLLRFLDTRGLGEHAYDPAEDIAAFNEQAHVVVVTVRLLDHALESILEPLREIRAAQPLRPVLLVLTHAHDAYPQQQHPTPDPFETGDWSGAPDETLQRAFDAQRERFSGLCDRTVVIDLTHPDDGFEQPAWGAARLTTALRELLPAAYRQTLLTLDDARQSLLDLQARRSAPHVAAYSLAAASAAAVPVPWVDIPIVLAIQSHMVYRLAQIHGQSPAASDFLKAIGPIGARLLTRLAIRELLKAVPYVGQAANAALAYAYTYGLGKACCWYFSRVKAGHVPPAADLEAMWRDEIQRATKFWSTHEGPSK